MATALNNLFAEYGYNLVALPKSGIAPLLLLYRNGADVSSADSKLTILFPVSDVPPPALLPDADVLPMIGQAEATFDAHAGVNFLQSLLEKLHMGKAGAKVKVNDQDKLTFSFQEIKESPIELLALDKFISGTPPDLDSFRAFGQKLKANELYVVTSVLKSNKFTIKITDKSGQSLDAEGSLKGILDAKVNVAHGAGHSITLSHKDEQVPLIFAFKAQRIIYDKPSFWGGGPGGFHIIEAPDVTMRDKGDIKTDELAAGTEAPDI